MALLKSCLSWVVFMLIYGDRDKLLESYYYMGRVYRDLNDAPEALKYFQKALDVAGDTRKYRLLSNVYSQMGMLYDYQNVYEEAIRMYEKAAEYKLLKGDSTSLSLVLRDIARVYDMVDKNDSALLYFQKAAIIANETGNRHRYSGILTEQGDLYRELGMYDKALECLFAGRVFHLKFQFILILHFVRPDGFCLTTESM